MRGNKKEIIGGLKKDTQLLVKSSTFGVKKISVEDLHNTRWAGKQNLTFYHDGGWVKGKTTKCTSEEGMYKITTENKKELYCSGNQVVLSSFGGELPVSELCEDRYVLFNTSASFPIPEHDMKLTYEQGLLLGAYLGDGSSKQHPTCNNVTTILSMNKDKVERLKIPLSTLGHWNISDSGNNVISMKTSDKGIYSFIKEWVYGDYSHTKQLNLDILQQSKAVRQGIIDGYYITDGGNSNRIYSSSLDLIYDMEALFTSLGVNTVINADDRRGEIRQFRDEKPFTPNFIMYCIRYYTPTHKRTQKGVYLKKLGQIYYKIKSIEKLPTASTCYTITLNNDYEPYITLPNGVIIKTNDK